MIIRITLIISCFINFPLFGQELLKDIVTSNASSHPLFPIDVNGTIYFQVGGVNNTWGSIWKSDGTVNGTELVRDTYINSQPTLTFGYFSPSKFNNSIIFPASQPYFGTEPWISDGTYNGTKMIKDINPGWSNTIPIPSGSGTQQFYQLGNNVVFQGSNSNTGSELYISDGTESGTYLLKDIYVGNQSSNPRNFNVLNNNKVIFTATDGQTGEELYVTDGTFDGTYLLKDINTTSSSYSIYGFVKMGNSIYFVTFSAEYGSELWKTDGTTNGTVLVSDINNGVQHSFIADIVAHDTFIAFSAYNGTDRELWISDGTSIGTFKKDIYANFNSSNPENLIRCGNYIYFTAENGINGRELWKTDGTLIGTTLVKDITPSNSNATFSNLTNDRIFHDLNGQLFFLANNGENGMEIWKSNGTSTGTTLLKDFKIGSTSASYRHFMKSGTDLYFIVNDDTYGYQLWKTDGTQVGTLRINGLPSNESFENAYPFIGVGNKMFLVAYNQTGGYELYITDGHSVTFLKDMYTRSFFDRYENNNFIGKTGNSEGLFFFYDNNKNGLELWKTDGTFANTALFFEFNPYPVSLNSFVSDWYYSGGNTFSKPISYKNKIYIHRFNAIWETGGVNPPHIIFSRQPEVQYSNEMCISNGILYFTFGGFNGTLYAYDGINSPVQIKTGDIIDKLVNVNGKLFFRLNNYGSGTSLWKTDGTVSGTMLVKNNLNIDAVIGVGNNLFLAASQTNYDYKLWVSDGSDSGTFMLNNITPTANGGQLYFTNFQEKLLLFKTDTGLWKSDGTIAGTEHIKDFFPGSNSDIIEFNFPDLNGKKYFKVQDGFGDVNYELWHTDGTTIGTNRVISNLLPGNYTVATDSLIYFVSGGELWKTNGTEIGTMPQADLNPNGNSNPKELIYHNNVVYFTANDGVHESEIFKLKQCNETLNLQNKILINKAFQAQSTINSEDKIIEGSGVVYDAGKKILLNQGFEVKKGAVFQTKLNGCSN